VGVDQEVASQRPEEASGEYGQSVGERKPGMKHWLEVGIDCIGGPNVRIKAVGLFEAL
jgi:hypothetical protein